MKCPSCMREMTLLPYGRQGRKWKRDDKFSEIMVEVRLTNSELTVWWPNQDTPVATLKGHWRGPIPPSTGPGTG
jgi:hypothetical protein